MSTSMELGPMFASQNFSIASLPRCPLPSGSREEAPMGSSMHASSAKRASQSRFAFLWTALHEAFELSPGEGQHGSKARVGAGVSSLVPGAHGAAFHGWWTHTMRVETAASIVVRAGQRFRIPTD